MAVVEECCVLKDQCSSRVISVGHSTGADVAAGNTMRSSWQQQQQQQQTLIMASTTVPLNVNIFHGDPIFVHNNKSYGLAVRNSSGRLCQ
jgi:hypothetical protein